MNLYHVSANCDWGNITDRASVEASSFKSAFGKAGRMAQRMARKSPKWISIKIEKIGRKEKATPSEVAH